MLSEKEILVMIMAFDTLLLIIGGIIFAIASLRSRDLIPWLPVFITLTIGTFFFTYQFVDPIYRLIANMLFAIAAIITFLAAFREYYHLFIKSSSQESQIKGPTIAIVVISPIILGFQIFIISLLIVTIIMLIRIYIKTKSTTRFFFMVSILAAATAMFFFFLDNFNIEGAMIFGTIIVTSYLSILMVSGIVALLEQKILRTISDKNNLKDIYSHNLGNILHSIFITYELIERKEISEKELHELNELLKDKIYEASELVKEIRKL